MRADGVYDDPQIVERLRSTSNWGDSYDFKFVFGGRSWLHRHCGRFAIKVKVFLRDAKPKCDTHENWRQSSYNRYLCACADCRWVTEDYAE